LNKAIKQTVLQLTKEHLQKVKDSFARSWHQEQMTS
jgi:hypothetical protein